MKKYLFLIPIAALLFVGGTSVKPRKPKDYALFFAVNNYESSSMDALRMPISDAEKIAAELTNNYGFACEIVRNPTLSDIQKKLNEYRLDFANGRRDRTGQLFVYFTGHGKVEYDEGYFLPTDTKPDFLSGSAMSYSIYRKMMDNIPCKHILVAIDACYSGTFDPKYGSKDPPIFGTRTGELGERDKLILEHDKSTTRLFFTSAATDQTTPDRSSFAKKLLEALKSRGGEDDILTSSETFTFLENASPRPRRGEFGVDEAGSSFLFIADTPPLGAGGTEGGKTVKSDRESWQNAQKQNTIPTYQNYIRQFPQGDFIGEAKEALRQLEQQEEDNAWAYAKSQNTVDGYNRFLSRYPNSIYANRARQLIKDLSFTFEPETVTVRGGTFSMGQSDPDIGGAGTSKDEQPVHSVTVSNFNMGKYEITVAQFKAFIDDDGYKTDAEKEGTSRIYNYSKNQWEDVKGVNWKCDAEGNIRPQSDYNHPVIHVSWNDAVAYCTWLSRKTSKKYRLPTEAEWEYAAGNGSRHTKYSWGNGDPSGKNGGNVADEVAAKKFNFTRNETNIFMNYDDGYAITAPVGQYNANDFGLHDMTGNVWEWCSDWYSSYGSSAVSNPTGAVTGSYRVGRGGSWRNAPQRCRVANRGNNEPADRGNGLGFRVVFAFQ